MAFIPITQEKKSLDSHSLFLLFPPKMYGVAKIFRCLGKKAAVSLNRNSPCKKDSSSRPPKVEEGLSFGKGAPLPRAPIRKKKSKKAASVGGVGEGES